MDQHNNYQENDYFIDRILDALHDHCNPDFPTADESCEGNSLWRITTPNEYLQAIKLTFSDNSEREIRRQIHQALHKQQLDRALFLIFSLARLQPDTSEVSSKP